MGQRGGAWSGGRAAWAGLAALWLALGGAQALPSLAAANPGGETAIPAILAVDIARPAVVRIETTYPATLTVQLCRDASATLRGAIAATGSGAFISAQGDILTADHVVDLPRADLDQATLATFAGPISQDLAARCGTATTPDAVYAAYLANPTLYQTVYAPPTIRAWLGTAFAGDYPQTDLAAVPSYPLTIAAQSGTDQHDLAVLRSPLTATLAVPLDLSADVAPTDALTVLGFPGPADVSARPASYLTDSIDPVVVSALKTDDAGGALIQVDGNVEHGDSGGPALNAAGQVVGVVSFALAETGATRFLQAASNVAPLVQAAGVNLAPGDLEVRWRQAMRDYGAGRWRAAAAALAVLAHADPLFQGALPYLRFAQAHASPATYPGGGTFWPLSGGVALWSLPGVLALASGVTTLLSGFSLLWLTRRRRRRWAAHHAPVSRPVPMLAVDEIPTALRPAIVRPAVPGDARTLPRLAVTALRPAPDRCRHGHRLPPHATFCALCGAMRGI